MALFIARWPDGSAWIVEAESMVDVAELLDEVDDPGACEVQKYVGPFAVALRPAVKRVGTPLLEFGPTEGDTDYEMQEAILACLRHFKLPHVLLPLKVFENTDCIWADVCKGTTVDWFSRTLFEFLESHSAPVRDRNVAGPRAGIDHDL